MEPIEEGNAIQKSMSEYDLTQEEIAKILGKSRQWIGDRLALALTISEVVQKALTGAGITTTQAVIISQLENKQDEFLAILIRPNAQNAHLIPGPQDYVTSKPKGQSDPSLSKKLTV